MGESNNNFFVEKSYFCKICNTNHSLKLSKNLVDDHTQFPFSYVYLHGKLFNILSTLYLDADLNIRGVEVVKLNNSENIFDKEQMIEIVQKLIEHAEQSNKEYNSLLKKYEELKKQLKDLKK